MELLKELFTLFSHLPTAISIVMSGVALLLVWWMNFRKVDIEEKTSSSAIHERQIDSLMKQIELLSEELEKTRQQLNDLHTQNIELMTQLREANRRIGELETMLEKHNLKK